MQKKKTVTLLPCYNKWSVFSLFDKYFLCVKDIYNVALVYLYEINYN